MDISSGWAVVGFVFGSGVVIRGVVVATQTRDAVRDLMREVGKNEPATGLFARMGRVETTVGEHREWFIRAGLDGERRHGDPDRRHTHD